MNFVDKHFGKPRFVRLHFTKISAFWRSLPTSAYCRAVRDHESILSNQHQSAAGAELLPDGAFCFVWILWIDMAFWHLSLSPWSVLLVDENGSPKDKGNPRNPWGAPRVPILSKHYILTNRFGHLLQLGDV